MLWHRHARTQPFQCPDSQSKHTLCLGQTLAGPTSPQPKNPDLSLSLSSSCILLSTLGSTGPHCATFPSCALILSVLPSPLNQLERFLSPSSPPILPGWGRTTECLSQLPRTQPVDIEAERHKLGSQGRRGARCGTEKRAIAIRMSRSSSLFRHPFEIYSDRTLWSNTT